MNWNCIALLITIIIVYFIVNFFVKILKNNIVRIFINNFSTNIKTFHIRVIQCLIKLFISLLIINELSDLIFNSLLLPQFHDLYHLFFTINIIRVIPIIIILIIIYIIIDVFAPNDKNK